MGRLLKETSTLENFSLNTLQKLFQKRMQPKERRNTKKEMKVVLYITPIIRTVLRGKYFFKVNFKFKRMHFKTVYF